MKIIHIVPALTKGGGERVAVDLANEAARRGHEVTMVAVTRADEAILRKDLDAAIEVLYVTDSPGRLARYPQVVRWVLANRRPLQGADIVHCHMTISALIGTLLFLLRKLGRGGRPAIVETYHAVGMPIPRWHTRVHGQLARRRDAVALMAEDPYWTAFAKAQRHIAVKIIPNGIAGPAAAPGDQERLAYRREVGVPDSCPFVVGTVGRLDPARQPWIYPAIFGPIARRFPEVHFVIGGAGPELARVEQAIAEEGLEGRVHLPGLVRDPRMAFSIMDLYLTLNVGPITGVAAIEAAFAGLPILAFQLLDGYQARESDWIWSSRDLSAISDRAIALIEQRERLAALALGQEAYAKANLSIEVMANAYDSLYKAALEKAACRSAGHS